jgi:hypothetical protein
MSHAIPPVSYIRCKSDSCKSAVSTVMLYVLLSVAVSGDLIDEQCTYVDLDRTYASDMSTALYCFRSCRHVLSQYPYSGRTVHRTHGAVPVPHLRSAVS